RLVVRGCYRVHPILTQLPVALEGGQLGRLPHLTTTVIVLAVSPGARVIVPDEATWSSSDPVAARPCARRSAPPNAIRPARLHAPVTSLEENQLSYSRVQIMVLTWEVGMPAERIRLRIRGRKPESASVRVPGR